MERLKEVERFAEAKSEKGAAMDRLAAAAKPGVAGRGLRQNAEQLRKAGEADGPVARPAKRRTGRRP